MPHFCIIYLAGMNSKKEKNKPAQVTTGSHAVREKNSVFFSGAAKTPLEVHRKPVHTTMEYQFLLGFMSRGNKVEVRSYEEPSKIKFSQKKPKFEALGVNEQLQNMLARFETLAVIYYP